MRPHIINDKKNLISGWYIDENLCDSIVDACSGRNRLKFDGQFKSSFRGYLVSQIKTFSKQLHVQYISELDKVFDLYKKEYPFLNTGMANFGIEKIKQTEAVQLQMYDPKFSYSRLHCENDGGPDVIKRCLVFMTYLNNVDDGGGTDFPYQNISTKAEKGLTLIWPAYWTHPHQGIVSETQKKIITTGWYTFQ